MQKRVAVIVSGIDEEYQSTIQRGICQYATTQNAHIYTFVAYGGLLHHSEHDKGEFQIYQLCDFAQFDGVILLTNSIGDPHVTADIVDRVSKCDVPVVCIDNDLDSKFYHVGIDNFRAMQSIVEHVVDFHGCKRIAYISGPESNPESIRRYCAFESVMQRAGIPIDPELVYYGSFRSCDGRDGANYFLTHSKEVPDAIICANDVMALATVLALDEQGIRVPEDCIVTGFDNTYSARNFYPSITSVERPLYQSGYLACQMVLEGNADIPRSCTLETRTSLRCSCGCCRDNDDHESTDVRKFRRDNFRMLESYQVNIPGINRMNCVLADCESIEEHFTALESFIKGLNCERFYLCLTEHWADLKKASNDQAIRFTDGCAVDHYTPNMQVPIAYVNGQFQSLTSFPTKQMVPDLELGFTESSQCYFMPLHYTDRCFGYCVIIGDKYNIKNPLQHTWLLNLANSLERIRKMIHLNKALEEVSNLYVMDPLCKINNRNGFNKFSREVLEDAKRDGRNIMMMFIDMDGLKYINDTFSHEEGDNALKQLAKAIRKSCQSSEVFARFGGDEFIIFVNDYTDADAKALEARIYARMQEYNSISGKPYDVAASIGYHIVPADEDLDLYQLITAADKKMYEEKKRKRVSRYLRHSTTPGNQ